MDILVKKTWDFIYERQLGEASGHDWWHTMRVYKMAVYLCRSIQEPVDIRIVELGALLHDIDDWKFNHGDENVGPAAAEAWLKKIHAGEKAIEQIPKIIYDLSYKGMDAWKEMPTIEGKIVQDADRLDAVGAIGIARCFAYGGATATEIFNPEIAARVDITQEQYFDRTIKSTQVNHFFEKLLLLKDLYNTPLAQKIGLQRHNYMVKFLKTMLEECNATNSQQYHLLTDHKFGIQKIDKEEKR